MKNTKISLRFSILSIYAVTFIVLILTIICVEYVFFYREISTVTNKMMKDVAYSVLEKLSIQISPAATSIKLTKSLFENGLINLKEMKDYTFYMAEDLPLSHLYNETRIVGWGDTQGNSIETSIGTEGSYSTVIINPQMGQYEHLYLDSNDHIIRTEIIPGNYDPRLQPWYITAVQANNIVWSDIFLSYPYKNPSISVSTPIYIKNVLKGVFKIEVKLIAISNFLAKLNLGKDGVAFIINGDDHLVAFPGMQWIINQEPHARKLAALEASGKPWLASAFELFNQNRINQFSYKYAGKTYLAIFMDIPEFSSFGWQVGVVIPQETFVGELEEENMIVLMISLLILALGILAATFISRRISEPMRLLVGETEEIKAFHLEGSTIINSLIKEVDYLGNAINSMKMNLRAFKKYLPSNLVRQLIETGEDIKLGGSKRVMTLFFSDIENFTTISENMDSEKLMLHLCEYLNELTKIIIKENGTVDKYIGDSIMAFWGAPLPDKDHCLHGCLAAIRCKRRLDELNRIWAEQGKSVFVTRFGIHTGEAIVGNIGSSDRLNYTALGDAINVASRLEEMNKVYGTSIIVSEEVVKILGEKFAFRFLDLVAVRGRVGSYKIYELLDEKTAVLTYDFNRYQELFEKGFNTYKIRKWEEAIHYFKECLKVYPQDKIAPIFIKRCEWMKENPPSENWGGVWHGGDLHIA